MGNFGVGLMYKKYEGGVDVQEIWRWGWYTRNMEVEVNVWRYGEVCVDVWYEQTSMTWFYSNFLHASKQWFKHILFHNTLKIDWALQNVRMLFWLKHP